MQSVVCLLCVLVLAAAAVPNYGLPPLQIVRLYHAGSSAWRFSGATRISALSSATPLLTLIWGVFFVTLTKFVPSRCFLPAKAEANLLSICLPRCLRAGD